ncbi:cytochrome c [Marinoscillum sp. MHG1-6]|uniref:c-type cytochrome n=1 Tax=Marinoscillum sp. MHG1-6 TaxID=2959627 RepID=UPI0021575E82|nr:cytochrome c [Marinoscillum sp. MHG1-6]
MLKKILLGLLALIILLVGGFVIYVQLNWNKTYDIPYPELQVSTDSAVIAKGEYLVKGPAHCAICHVSSFDEMIKADGGEDIPLKGGVRFPLGPLGIISPANLTPDPETGIGRYTDGQLFRMMRHAVKPDGTGTLSLMMPFWNMADEDLVAIVSYLRSCEPIKNVVEPPSYTFVGKMVRATAPLFEPVYDPTPPDKAPPMEATIERGEYLARYVANCVGCHTARDPMTFEAIGPEYAGGMEMEPLPELHIKLGIDPDLWTRSVNITPHPNSALARFKTLDAWITRFRQGRLILNSPMDWGPFSRMSDEDLEALWLYLHSLDPIENDTGPVVFKKE